MRFDNPSKQPYRIIASRPHQSGRTVNIVQDIDEDIFYIGINLNPDNVREGGPFGCKTYYTREEALDELNYLAL